MHGYTHHCRTQDTSMENISRLKNLQHRSIFMFVCLGTIHRLVQEVLKDLSER